MTQVLIDRDTLEQMVVALNNAEDALNNSQALIAGRERFGFAKTCYAVNENALGFVSPALNKLRAALANAEPDPLFVKGALTGLVNAQIEDMWPTKSVLEDAPAPAPKGGLSD